MICFEDSVMVGGKFIERKLKVLRDFLKFDVSCQQKVKFLSPNTRDKSHKGIKEFFIPIKKAVYRV